MGLVNKLVFYAVSVWLTGNQCLLESILSHNLSGMSNAFTQSGFSSLAMFSTWPAWANSTHSGLMTKPLPMQPKANLNWALSLLVQMCGQSLLRWRAHALARDPVRFVWLSADLKRLWAWKPEYRLKTHANNQCLMRSIDLSVASCQQCASHFLRILQQRCGNPG